MTSNIIRKLLDAVFFINTKDDDVEWVDVFLITRVETTAPEQTV